MVPLAIVGIPAVAVFGGCIGAVIGGWALIPIGVGIAFLIAVATASVRTDP